MIRPYHGTTARNAAFIALVAVALGVRALYVTTLADQVLGCRTCALPGWIHADLPFAAVLMAVFLCAGLRPEKLWQTGLRLVAVLGLLLYLLDLIVLWQFNSRLWLADLLVYLAQPAQLTGHLKVVHPVTALAAAGLVMGGGLWLVLPDRPTPATRAERFHRSPGKARSGLKRLAMPASPLFQIVVLLVLAVSIRAGLSVPPYVHAWALQNVFEINLPGGLSQPYSETRIAQARERVDARTPAAQCRPGRAEPRHVVMLLLESWSMYHSRLYSGLNDWTPRLDALARQGIQYTRMHAGGFNTNEGLISLFTGRDFVLPLKPAHQFGPFEGAWKPQMSLPRALADAGYHTGFLTSGDLGFTRKGQWLAQIGFQYLEGHDHPGYDQAPRLLFGSAPDEFLYARALAYLEERLAEPTPTLTVIEGVSSHHPFVHPHTGERSEQAVMRYMDEAAAHFIESLRQRGFLDEGLLIVSSDHRAMTMVQPGEWAQFGRASASLIPAFALGAGIEAAAVEEPFHQADWLATLLRQTRAESCTRGPLRDALAPGETESRCLLHARGDARDEVDVFCAEGEGTLRVRGDDSRFVHVRGLSTDIQQQLLDEVLLERVRASETPDPAKAGDLERVEGVEELEEVEGLEGVQDVGD